MLLHALEQRPLDFQIFHDCFDNQIAVFDLCEIVVEVSDTN
jgi:hypothetical protein